MRFRYGVPFLVVYRQAKTKQNIDLVFETIARRLPRTHTPTPTTATTNPIVAPAAPQEKKGCCINQIVD